MLATNSLAKKWCARLMHFFGTEKPKRVTPELELYCTEKVLAMAKRVALKSATWEIGPKHMGLLMVEQLPQEGGGIVSAEKLMFVKRWTESNEQDPLIILFLFDCPEWNNPYPVTDFDNNLGWFIDNYHAQQEAYTNWKRRLLSRI